MTKISTQAAQAMLKGAAYRNGNTQVSEGSLYLYGRLIATLCDDRVVITLAGLNIIAARERLNTLFNTLGSPACVYQRNFRLYLNDPSREGTVEIDPHLCYVVPLTNPIKRIAM